MRKFGMRLGAALILLAAAASSAFAQGQCSARQVLGSLAGGQNTCQSNPVVTTVGVRSSGAAFNVIFASNDATLAANRTLNVVLNNGDRTISLSGNLTIGGALTTAGSSALTLTTTGVTDATFPTGTITLAQLGANTFVASQALTLTTNASLQYAITNASTGTSATAQVSVVNSANSGSFGIASTGYTGISALQNFVFITASSGSAGVALYQVGDKPTVIFRSGIEIARFPVAGTQTLVLGLAGTSTGVLGLSGSTSGVTAITGVAAASGTWTLPAATDQFVGRATVDTLTNKTLTSPTINGGTHTSITSFSLRDTGAAFDLAMVSTVTGISANRTITWDTANGSRSIALAGNLSLGGSFSTSGASALILTTTGSTNVTLPTSGTLAILGANTFIANQALTLTTDAALTYVITNASTGTSAIPLFQATNSANNASFGIGGTGYTGITLLQNRAFVLASTGSDGIVLHNIGDDPIVFSLNGAERARFQPASLSGTNGVITYGLTGSLLGCTGHLGNTSGVAMLCPQAAAGSPTLTMGTTSGTIAASATSPLAISATTGVITCTTCGVTGTGLNQFASTTSAQLAGVLSDETGTGASMFATSPSITTDIRPASDGGATSGTSALRWSTTFTNAITADGTSARAWSLGRATSGVGVALTVQAGGAQSGGTDLTGGNLILSGGIATGTGGAGGGNGHVAFWGAPAAGGAGTTDRSPVELIRIYNIGGGGFLCFRGSSCSTTNYAILGSSGDGNTYFNGASGFDLRVANNPIGTVTATAMTFTPTTAATSTITGSLINGGGFGNAGAGWFGTYVATGVVAVASLPACGAGIKAARMFVNDNNTALAFAAVITTGGAIQTPVYCDGTVWRQG